MAQLGAGRRRAVARAGRPQPVGRRPARHLLRAAARLRRLEPHRLQVAGRAVGGRPPGAARVQAHDRRAQQGLDQDAGARQQPLDRPQGPRRPRPRRREGPALARRQGLHGLRGAPPVRLRPDDGDQHLRLQRLHAEGEPLPVRVLGLPEPRLAEGEAEGGPGLLPALRRHPRPAPARHHAARPVATPERRRAPSTTCPPPRRTTRRPRPRPGPTKPTGPEGKPTDEAKKRAEELAERIEETLGIELPDLPAGPEIPALPIPLPSLPGGRSPAPPSTQQLLDFLLAP